MVFSWGLPRAHTRTPACPNPSARTQVTDINTRGEVVGRHVSQATGDAASRAPLDVMCVCVCVCVCVICVWACFVCECAGMRAM